MTRPLPNKTILRVLLAGVVLLLFCGAAVGVAGAAIPDTPTTVTTVTELEAALTGLSEFNIILGNNLDEGSDSDTFQLTKECTISMPGILDLNGKVIKAKSGNRLFTVTASGDGFTLKDSTPTAEHTTPVTYTNPVTGQTVTVNGGCITGGSASGDGGGVRVVGTFTMSGGNIVGNTSGWGGGGVSVSDGTFTMNGGNIAGNTSNKDGGGVWVNAGTFTMDNGTISKNTAGNDGGGVLVSSQTGSSFTMNNGSITENVANGSTNGGGGVIVYGVNGSFTMNGGKITSNTAANAYGGGLSTHGPVTMTAGEITGNSAKLGGGGVYVVSNGTFKVSGAPKISGNTDKAATPAANNVYLASGKTITVTGKLESGAKIWVNPKNNAAKGNVFTSGWGSKAEITDPSTVFTPDTTDPATPGAGLTVSNSSLEVTFADPNYQVFNSAGQSLGKAVSLGAAYLLVPDGGKITVLQNVTETAQTNMTGSKSVTLDLNDKVLKRTGSGSVIKVGSGVNLTLTDTAATKTGKYFQVSEGTTLKNKWEYVSLSGSQTKPGDATDGNTIALSAITSYDSDEAGGWAYRASSTSPYKYKYVTVPGGCITGGSGDATTRGGGVHVEGTFNMNGGNIVGNSSSNDGGGVNIWSTDSTNARFSMTDGSIAGNTTRWGGGVNIKTKDSTSASMKGGMIVGNYASEDGGGVYIALAKQEFYGAFTMSGGTIKGNKAAKTGGGVCIGHGDTFTMSGTASITGNYASEGGGGVYVATSLYGVSNFTMSGGTIDKNTATSNGGGVFNNGAFKVSGTPKISGNTDKAATPAANNVYLASGKTITITDKLNSGAKIWVNPAAGAAPGTAFTSGWSSKAEVSDPSTVFVADGENYIARISGDEVTFAANYEVFDSTGLSLGKAVSLGAAYQLVSDGGKIKVLQDVTEAAQTTMDGSKSVTLDLNGKTITAVGTFTDGLIKWSSTSKKLTITDSTDTPGSLNGADKTRVLSINAGEVVLEKGIITGGSATQGGGVKVSSTFTMNGGKIENNTAQTQGGGVWVNGTFTMNGGEIKKNLVDNSSDGGGVYVDGTFKVSGTPVISDNTKTDKTTPTNVYLTTDGTLQIIGKLETTANIRIKSPDATGKIFAQAGTPTGGTEYTITAADAGFFHTDSNPAQKAAVMTSPTSPKTSLVWVSTTITLTGSGETGNQTTAAARGKNILYPSSGFTALVAETGYTFKGWGPGDAPTAALVVFNSTDNSISLPTSVGSFNEYLTQIVNDVVWNYTGTEEPLILKPVFTLNEPEIYHVYTDAAGNHEVKLTKGTDGKYTLDFTYDGTDHKLKATSLVDSGSYECTWTGPSSNSNATPTVGEQTLKDVSQSGTYVATLKKKDSSESITTAPVVVTISPKPVTITWDTTTTLTYNGTPQAPTAVADGVIAGDTVNVTVTGKQTKAGTGYTATADALDGTSKDNYTLPATKPTQTFSIAKKPIQVTGSTVSVTKVYDGNTTAEITAVGSLPDDAIVSGDDVTLNTGSAAANYNNKDVGTGKTVTFSGYSLDGTDEATGNYELSQPADTTAAITAKPLSNFSLDGTPTITKTYDGTTDLPTGVTYTILTTDAAGSEVPVITYDGATSVYNSANVADANSVTFKAVSLKTGEAVNANYSIAPNTNYVYSESGKVQITARDISSGTVITLVNDNLTYTGSEQTVQIQKVEHTIAGTSTKLPLTDSDYTITSGDKGTAIGNYTLTISGTDNFTGTATKEWHIIAGQTAVTLDPQGGTGGTASVTASYGQPMPPATMPTQSGYTFNGYYDAQSGGTQYYKADGTSAKNWDKTVTAATLYAHWTRNAATVTFNVQGHGTAPASQTIDIGSKVTRPADPSAVGYTFGGWYKEPDCINEWNFESDTVQGDMTLYAKWTINTYIVTFNVQGHGTAPASRTVNYGEKVIEPADPSAEGLIFDGWYTDTACTTPWNFETGTVTEDMTLYAKWVHGSYTITFNGNGGTFSTASKTVRFGDTVLLSDVTVVKAKEGYTHSGWAVTPDGKAVYAAKQMVQDLGDITLYAVWTKDAEVISATDVKVIAEDGTPISGVTVQLKEGNAVLGYDTTSDDGLASFHSLIKGTYNLVAATKDGKVVTTMVPIPYDAQPVLLIIPDKDISSIVDVSVKAGTPAVIVDGVSEAAAKEAGEADSTVLTVKVEAKIKGDTAGTEQETQKEIEKIIAIAGGSELQYLGITVEKSENGGEPEPVLTTQNVLKFTIPYDFTGKKQIKLYRCHGDEAKQLKEITPEDKKEDGTYVLDKENGLIYLYADKFSTYSVGYITDSGKRGHSNPGTSYWATETPTVTPTPMVTPTETPTPDVPTVKPTEQQTPAKSPVPLAGLLAGLGAATAVAGLMRRK